jgi:hypothetical protein
MFLISDYLQIIIWRPANLTQSVSLIRCGHACSRHRCPPLSPAPMLPQSGMQPRMRRRSRSPLSSSCFVVGVVGIVIGNVLRRRCKCCARIRRCRRWRRRRHRNRHRCRHLRRWFRHLSVVQRPRSRSRRHCRRRLRRRRRRWRRLRRRLCRVIVVAHLTPSRPVASSPSPMHTFIVAHFVVGTPPFLPNNFLPLLPSGLRPGLVLQTLHLHPLYYWPCCWSTCFAFPSARQRQVHSFPSVPVSGRDFSRPASSGPYSPHLV